MRLNSPEQLETGRRLIAEFGSWSNVRKNCYVNRSGVYVLKVPQEEIEAALRRLSDEKKTARSSFCQAVKKTATRLRRLAQRQPKGTAQ